MKYRVPVTVMARSSYTVEVEAPNERKAEEAAIEQWRQHTSSDFQVADIDEAQAEAEQISWNCEGPCGKEITYEEWAKGDSWCLSCVAKEEAHCAEI